jgi:serine protease Do
MIRKTLPRTKEATWCVFVPSPTPGAHGAPVPIGTCFFVDPSGYLLTANHVVVDEAGNPRDILWLQRPPTPPDWGTAMIQGIEIVERWPDVDLALLKADFGANATKAWAEGRTDFPYVPLSFDIPEDGTPVYGYGFPIQPTIQVVDLGGAIMALGGLRPRTTSAIVASNVEQIGPVQSSGDPSFIVIDKAWNYGNSGGPLILQETGEAVGVAVRFQPVRIEQSPGVYVVVPSLYGAASAVRNIADSLRASVPIFAR